jgi:hypothetical protein
MAKKQNSLLKSMENMLFYAHHHTSALNQSKIFAGIMIVIVNIASKFVTFKVSKTVEAYLKFTFSRHLLVFAATWLGTRDIYIALIMTLLFIIIIDFLFNEKSRFCCLPASFVNQHVSKLEGLETQMPTAEEIVKAKIILEKANAKEEGSEKTLFDANHIPIELPTSNY